MWSIKRKSVTVISALGVLGLLLASCGQAPKPTPSFIPTAIQVSPTFTAQPTATFTSIPLTPTPTPIPPTATPTVTSIPTATSIPTPTPTPDYTALFPPFLSYDWYPNGMTREEILARLPKAERKTGGTSGDEEVWSGVIRITGDYSIHNGAKVVVEPGTIIFIAARSDDQHKGIPCPKDQFNPKDPVKDEAYVKSRVWINLDHGTFIAKGTPDRPVIITSDSPNPQSDDWEILTVGKGSRLEMEYVLMEYFRVFGISSSEVKISSSIIRNMMETMVILGQGENLLDLNPIITQNYIYNCGHNCITIRTGSPKITHNIIRARPDMEFPGFEYGAVAFDFFTKTNFEHNFVEGGPPVQYEGYDIWGKYHKFLYSTGLQSHSYFGVYVKYNTFCNCGGIHPYPGGSGLEINAHPGMVIKDNNFIDNRPNLAVFESFEPEPSDIWQKKLLEKYREEHPITYIEAISVANNYWGTANEDEIRDLIAVHAPIKVKFKPYKTAFVKEALPDWSWLEAWLR